MLLPGDTILPPAQPSFRLHTVACSVISPYLLAVLLSVVRPPLHCSLTLSLPSSFSYQSTTPSASPPSLHPPAAVLTSLCSSPPTLHPLPPLAIPSLPYFCTLPVSLCVSLPCPAVPSIPLSPSPLSHFALMPFLQPRVLRRGDRHRAGGQGRGRVCRHGRRSAIGGTCQGGEEGRSVHLIPAPR